MTIERIIDYILHTPHNTNKAILRQMLEELIKDSSNQPDVEEIIYDGGTEK